MSSWADGSGPSLTVPRLLCTAVQTALTMPSCHAPAPPLPGGFFELNFLEEKKKVTPGPGCHPPTRPQFLHVFQQAYVFICYEVTGLLHCRLKSEWPLTHLPKTRGIPHGRRPPPHRMNKWHLIVLSLLMCNLTQFGPWTNPCARLASYLFTFASAVPAEITFPALPYLPLS